MSFPLVPVSSTGGPPVFSDCSTAGDSQQPVRLPSLPLPPSLVPQGEQTDGLGLGALPLQLSRRTPDSEDQIVGDSPLIPARSSALEQWHL